MTIGAGAPALVLAAHGTRSAAGVDMMQALAAAVSSAGPQVSVAFVDVLGPTPAEVLQGLGQPAVVVPAFLAAGYHVHTDVPGAVAASGHPAVTVTRPLGPDPLLAQVQESGLRAAGWRPGDAVVFAAAGSSDLRALRDVRRAAALLSHRLNAPVPTGFAATAQPRIGAVVARARETSRQRVFIASYLLAHGLFQQRLGDAGADGVSEPLGADPALAELVLRRYRSGVTQLAAAA